MEFSPKRFEGVENFCAFYHTKQELTDFLRARGLPVSGSKAKLTDRVLCFLKTGAIEAPSVKRKTPPPSSAVDETTPIEENVVCSQTLRAFFKDRIGRSFSFCTEFQNWLKNNAGKTYGEAVAAYRRIAAEKKSGKTEISRQFECNTYVRDFFADNPDKSLKDAAACWNMKKESEVCRRYERSDLAALKNIPSKK